MNKALYFCLTGFLFLSNYCSAQVPAKKDTVRVVQIISGQSLREKSIDSVNKIETIAGNVLMREGFTKFSCDSAIIDRKQNTIEAFGNVHINDADSLHTYSQYLKYYGTPRMAYLKKNVKLNDTKGTLFTEDLDYDLAAGVGKFHNGGKVINGSTVLTSNDGIYYADTKDVYFRNNVDLTDPKYKIKADSLLYNTQAQVVTFIGPTYIKSKDADIFTRQGTYDLKSGNAFFGTRSLVTDSSKRVYQADRIALDDKAGLAELEGSAVIKDSTNGVIVTANHIYLNRNNSSFLGTNKPVMIIQQEKDSTFISADTLFSGFTTNVTNQILPVKNDSAQIDSTITKPSSKDSFQTDTLKGTKVIKLNKRIISAKYITDSVKNDSAAKRSLPNDSLQINPLTKIIEKPNIPDSSASHFKDSLKIDSSPGRSFPNDSLQITPLKQNAEKENKSDTSERPFADSLKIDSAGRRLLQNNSLNKDSSKAGKVEEPDSVRYFLAFHHVRIFNDSLQSVCDSLFFSAQDSVFRLFYNPIVWLGQTQITGDTIYLYTKNKKPDRLYVFENGMIVNKNQNDFYNQVAGKTINIFFKDGVIDYARVKGQKAESIYYVLDNDSAYVGMNRATSDVIDLYFKERQLNKVKYINDVHSTTYPMSQIPVDEKFLKNFKWEDKRRPKNKLELFE
ncbi:MAG: OstA-like protein [Ginsengibacter sp.]